MKQQDLKLEIASRLLSAIISQDRNRHLSDRLDDIQHSLEVAAELIRRSEEVQSPPAAEHTLHPHPASRTRDRVIQREASSFPRQLEDRRGDTTPKPGRGPALH